MKFHIISIAKKVNDWVGMSKSEREKNLVLYWEYDLGIICKYYGETFEKNGSNDRENFELIWDNSLKHSSNLAKEFYKNIVKE